MLASLASALALATTAHAMGGYGGICGGATGNAATFNFAIGDIPAKIIVDTAAGEGLNPFGFATDFSIVQRAFKARRVPEDAPSFFANVLYIEHAGEKIIFDSGNGAAAGGALVPQLMANGISPDDITVVVLTHGHSDHIRGLIVSEESDELTFPNAMYYISQTEWDYWLQEDVPTFTSTLPPERLAVTAEFAKLVFGKIESKVKLFERGDEILPGITSMATSFYHTPGHTVFTVTSGNDTLLVAGDALTNIITSIENPLFLSNFDLRKEEGPAGRFALLDKVVAGKWLLQSYHSTFPGLGYVVEDGGTRFTFHEKAWGITLGAVATCPAADAAQGPPEMAER